MKKAPLADRIAPFATTVFSEFSALALKSNAVNLGQGFPNFEGPEEIRDAAVRALRSGLNQYAIGAGALELRKAISEHARRFYGMQVDPEAMVSVTSGATEAIFDTLQGLVNPGDEVVLFEPFYDSYAASVVMAGGTCRCVVLRPPDAAHTGWWFFPEELRAAFSAKTRLVIVNTPHNPTGKVYTRGELEQIAALCVEFDAFCLADEVYEHLVFAPATHVRMATLPGMWERTVTVSSAGKSFSFTGWKVGWAIAAPPLREAVQRTHQFVTFATASPLQAAVAQALRLPDAFYASLQDEYTRRKERLARGLARAGFTVFPTEGTYFMMADIRPLGFADDFAFCRHLTEVAGVAAIPPSAFYSAEHVKEGQGFARFAFCKTDDLLDEAEKRLVRWFESRR